MKDQQNTDIQVPVMDDESITRAVVEEKLIDALTPGYQAEFSPEEAEYAGAFVEDALNEKDAADSVIDLGREDDLIPAFITDGGPSNDLPNFISTTNICELYGWTPDKSPEWLEDAIARRNAQLEND